MTLMASLEGHSLTLVGLRAAHAFEMSG